MKGARGGIMAIQSLQDTFKTSCLNVTELVVA